MRTIFVLIVCLAASYASNQWPNHDISTLKLLQVVHKHGERAPTEFAPNDPYKEAKYWKAGLGELTAKGKYQMFKVGEYIRNEYNDYLGDKYSPREVYARSAASSRCLESVSTLLAGAYPPKGKDWQWNNGSDAELGKNWQPISVQTFIPEKEDLVCNEGKHCELVNNITDQIYSQPIVKKFEQNNSDLYKNLTKIVGKKIDGIWAADSLYDTLRVELDNNYFWNKSWTQEEEKRIVDQLYYSQLMGYRYDWDSPVIRRLRAGGLVRELNNNFQTVLDKKNSKKMYVYSTYGAHIGALMHALDVFNDNIPPFGATLLFELHQKKNSADNTGYFVRLFYKNDTDVSKGVPHSVPFTDCNKQTDCPLNQYITSTKHLLYDDFNKECKN